MATIAFRISEQLEERVRRAAREETKTTTEIIREALDLYLGQRQNPQASSAKKRGSVAETLKDDIGVWDGPAESSVKTGQQLRGILGEKHTTRRG